MRNFRKILKTVVIFLLIVGVLSAFFIGCYLKGENYHYQDGRERDAVAGSLDYIVSGTSNSLFGIKPDVISYGFTGSCYSLSGTMMTLEGRRALLEQELGRNPNVKMVLLEVSPDTLLRDREEEGPTSDLQILGRLNDAGLRWDFFRENFPVREWPAVYYDMVSKGIDCAAKLATGDYTTENQYMTAGYYENHNPDKPIPNNYSDLYHAQTLPETPRAENVEMLAELVELCKQNDRDVLLIMTPQSKYFNCVYSNLDFFHRWYSEFAEAHGITYYNFNLAYDKLDKLFDDTCYYDETHLNAYGAEIFSWMLEDILYWHTQGRDNSFYFFDSYEDITWTKGFFD